MQCRLTLREDDPHLQVAGGQPNDGRFVQLRRNGRWERQHFGQLIKFTVLLFPSSPCRGFRLLLHVDAASSLLLLLMIVTTMMTMMLMRLIAYAARCAPFTSAARFASSPSSIK